MRWIGGAACHEFINSEPAYTEPAKSAIGAERITDSPHVAESQFKLKTETKRLNLPLSILAAIRRQPISF